MDDYKKQIFSNTHAVLEVVPPGLKPASGRQVIISDMDPDTNTPFFEVFVSNEKLVYARGSFGFAHPNFTMIDKKIRINPGLDSSDTSLYKEFFSAMEEKLKELGIEN